MLRCYVLTDDIDVLIDKLTDNELNVSMDDAVLSVVDRDVRHALAEKIVKAITREGRVLSPGDDDYISVPF